MHELWALLNFVMPDVFENEEIFDSWFDVKIRVYFFLDKQRNGGRIYLGADWRKKSTFCQKIALNFRNIYASKD